MPGVDVYTHVPEVLTSAHLERGRAPNPTNPDRRVRLLDRSWPWIDAIELVMLTIPAERSRFSPGSARQRQGFGEAVTGTRRVDREVVIFWTATHHEPGF